MLIVYGSARIAEGDIERLRPAAEKMIAASRAEAGCIEYAYAFDLIDPTVMRIIERWKDADALAEHFATAHMAEWRKTLAGIDVRSIEIYRLEGDEEVLPR